MAETMLSETKLRFVVDFREKQVRDLTEVPLLEMSLNELLYFVLMGDARSPGVA